MTIFAVGLIITTILLSFIPAGNKIEANAATGGLINGGMFKAGGEYSSDGFDGEIDLFEPLPTPKYTIYGDYVSIFNLDKESIDNSITTWPPEESDYIIVLKENGYIDFTNVATNKKVSFNINSTDTDSDYKLRGLFLYSYYDVGYVLYPFDNKYGDSTYQEYFPCVYVPIDTPVLLTMASDPSHRICNICPQPILTVEEAEYYYSQWYYDKGYNDGYSEGYNEAHEGLKDFYYDEGYDDGYADGETISYDNGYDVGYEKGLGDGAEIDVGSDFFYAAMELVKAFFVAAGQFLGTPIIGNMSLGTIFIGIPAAFMILNAIINLIKNLISAGGNKDNG